MPLSDSESVQARDLSSVSIACAPREDSPGLGWGLKVIARLTSTFEIDQGPGGQGTELRLTL